VEPCEQEGGESRQRDAADDTGVIGWTEARNADIEVHAPGGTRERDAVGAIGLELAYDIDTIHAAVVI
jgi:hypothetical protein